MNYQNPTQAPERVQAPAERANQNPSRYNAPKVRTFDISLAAFLLAKNVMLHHVHNGHLVRFYFDDFDGEATRLEEQFCAGHVLVDARTYARAMHKVKKILRAWHAEQAQQAKSEQGATS